MSTLKKISSEIEKYSKLLDEINDIRYAKVFSDRIGLCIAEAFFEGDNNIANYLSSRIWSDFLDKYEWALDIIQTYLCNIDTLDTIREEYFMPVVFMITAAIVYLSYIVRLKKHRDIDIALEYICEQINKKKIVFEHLVENIINNIDGISNMSIRILYNSYYSLEEKSIGLVNAIESLSEIRVLIFDILSPDIIIKRSSYLISKIGH